MTSSFIQVVKYRYKKEQADSEVLRLRVRLYQGSNKLIASWEHRNLTNIVTEAVKPLNLMQKDNITDYNDLFLEFDASGVIPASYRDSDPVEFRDSDPAEFR